MLYIFLIGPLMATVAFFGAAWYRSSDKPSSEDAIARFAKDVCQHTDTVEVRTLADELVAYICMECDADLPSDFKGKVSRYVADVGYVTADTPELLDRACDAADPMRTSMSMSYFGGAFDYWTSESRVPENSVDLGQFLAALKNEDTFAGLRAEVDRITAEQLKLWNKTDEEG